MGMVKQYLLMNKTDKQNLLKEIKNKKENSKTYVPPIVKGSNKGYICGMYCRDVD